MKVRSLVTTTHETLNEAGAAVSPPTVIVVAAAVVQQALRALAALWVQPGEVRGYGKGAIVGVERFAQWVRIDSRGFLGAR